MTARACSHCAFYEATNSSFGECRRYAPRGYSQNLDSNEIWPMVSEEHWCGEFKPYDKSQP